MCCYDFNILFDYRFDKFQFLLFELVVGDHFDREYVVFCLAAIFYHMNVDWRMVIGIKVESVTEKDEDSWHKASFRFYTAKLGNKIITSKKN